MTIARFGEQGVEGDVARKLYSARAGARTYRASVRVERGCDLGAAPDGRVAIGGQERRDFERISLQSRAGGRGGNAGRIRAASNATIARTQTTSINVNPRARFMARYCDALLISAAEPAPPGSPLGPYELIS